MKIGFLRRMFLFFAPFLVIPFFFFPLSGQAAWYLNWSCGSPIGRPSGREGPYANKSACESDLARAQSACASAGGSFSGGCSGSDDYRPRSGARQPDYNYDEDILRQQELQRQREAEEKRRQIKEAEEESKRLAEEAQRSFQKHKEEALKSVKGTGGAALQIKSGTDFFGIKGSPDVALKKPGVERTEITTAWEQLHCGMAISGFVLQKANPKDNNSPVDFEEVHYLADQAIKAMTGEKISVQCPEASSPPRPYAQIKLGNDSTVVNFYKRLLRATEKQTERIDQVEKQMQQVKIKRQEVCKQIEEKEKEVTRLKKEVEKVEKMPPAPRAEDKSKEVLTKDEMEAKRRALAEARGVLEKAKEAQAQVDRLIQAAEKEKVDANKRLGDYEEMFNEVRADPGKAPQYLDKFKE